MDHARGGDNMKKNEFCIEDSTEKKNIFSKDLSKH